MFDLNTSLDYALLLLKSIGKKSFTALGRTVGKAGDIISRLLLPADIYFKEMQNIAIELFRSKKRLTIMIDETLIRKMHSRYMRGSGWFYDTVLCKSFRAYKLIIATVSDGNYTLPLECEFLFDQKLCTTPVSSREDFVLRMIQAIIKLFPGKQLIFVFDGAFATKSYLEWCIKNNIATELRMPSNRVVTYKGKRLAIRKIQALRPKGRQFARTVKVLWYDMFLYITADRRLDKNGQYTVVFQVATYNAKAHEHVDNYRKRWGIEKLIRTCKQSCGLQDCYSIQLQTQFNHVSATLFSFAIAQIQRKKQKLSTPEAAIRSIRLKNIDSLKSRLSSNYASYCVAKT